MKYKATGAPTGVAAELEPENVADMVPVEGEREFIDAVQKLDSDKKNLVLQLMQTELLTRQTLP